MIESTAAWVGWGFAAVAALYGLHRLGLYCERRGWLNYTRRSRRGRLSLVLAAAIDPNARHILEIQEEEAVEQDGSGGDTHPGSRPRTG